MIKYPVALDGRYFIVKNRLWRCTNPALEHSLVTQLETDLGKARAAVKKYKDHPAEFKTARVRVHEANIALGERGPLWWTDGAPDYNRWYPKNTRYRQFWMTLSGQADD